MKKTWIFSTFLAATLCGSERFFSSFIPLAPPQSVPLPCDCFNSGAIPLGDQILCLNRCDYYFYGRDQNLLCVSLNDQYGELIAELSCKDLEESSTAVNGSEEDPRVFRHGNSIMSVWTSTESGLRYGERFFNLAEFHLASETNSLVLARKRRIYADDTRSIEKNWVPIEGDQHLRFVYSLFPLRILEIPAENQDAEIVFAHDVVRTGKPFYPYPGRILSNSTNFINVELAGRRCLLGMYHFFVMPPQGRFRAPSDGRPIKRGYFTGFVALNGEYPYQPVYCTPPVLDAHFDAPGKDRIIFPTNAWIEEDDFCCVMGVQDKGNIMARVAVAKVLERCSEWPVIDGQPLWSWNSRWPGAFRGR